MYDENAEIRSIRGGDQRLTEAADGRYDKNVRSGHPGKEKDGSRKKGDRLFLQLKHGQFYVSS